MPKIHFKPYSLHKVLASKISPPEPWLVVKYVVCPSSTARLTYSSHLICVSGVNIELTWSCL